MIVFPRSFRESQMATNAQVSGKSARRKLPREVISFFCGPDSTLSKQQLLKRNVDFMRRCATGKLVKGKESMRGDGWVNKLPKAKRQKLLELIFKYDDWSEKTDPRGIRGNGIVRFEGNYVLWAIRAVDLTVPGTLILPTPWEVCLLVKHSSEI